MKDGNESAKCTTVKVEYLLFKHSSCSRLVANNAAVASGPTGACVGGEGGTLECCGGTGEGCEDVVSSLERACPCGRAPIGVVAGGQIDSIACTALFPPEIQRVNSRIGSI